MTYSFKAAEEAAWFVAVAVGTQIAQYLLTFNPDTITDWHHWAISLGAAAIRAAAGAVLSLLAKRG